MQFKGKRTKNYSRGALFQNYIRYYRISDGTSSTGCISNCQPFEPLCRIIDFINAGKRPVHLDIVRNNKLYTISRYEQFTEDGFELCARVYTTQIVDDYSPAYWNLKWQSLAAPDTSSCTFGGFSNIGAQQLLTVETKSNGNIAVSGLGDTTLEFMPATPSGDPMHYAYVAAGAVWNNTTGFWELNGLTDLTTDEMRVIYREAHLTSGYYVAGEFANSNSRTNICNAYYYSSTNLVAFAYNAKNMEVAVTGRLNLTTFCANILAAFEGCTKLRELPRVLSLYSMSDTTNAFRSCAALETVRIRYAYKNISLADSPLLTSASVLYAVENVDSTSPGTVLTLHAEAYARAMADESVVAALASHTNISLASAEEPATTAALSEDSDAGEEIRIVGNEIVAPTGRFITQVDEVSDDDRLFFARKTWGVNDDLLKWRTATVEERSAWQERQAASAPVFESADE